jgi:hypothetical protein
MANVTRSPISRSMELPKSSWHSQCSAHPLPVGQSPPTDIGLGSGFWLARSGRNLCVDGINQVVYCFLPYLQSGNITPWQTRLANRYRVLGLPVGPLVKFPIQRPTHGPPIEDPNGDCILSLRSSSTFPGFIIRYMLYSHIRPTYYELSPKKTLRWLS